jgi:hypothetical protein
MRKVNELSKRIFGGNMDQNPAIYESNDWNENIKIFEKSLEGVITIKREYHF